MDLKEKPIYLFKLDDLVPDSPAILFTTVTDLLKQPDIKLDLMCPLLNQVINLKFLCFER